MNTFAILEVLRYAHANNPSFVLVFFWIYVSPRKIFVKISVIIAQTIAGKVSQDKNDKFSQDKC